MILFLRSKKGSVVVGELIVFACIAISFIIFYFGVNNASKRIVPIVKERVGEINYVR